MKRIVLFLMLFLAGPVLAEELNVLVFGDSLSAGYKLDPEETFISQLGRALTKKGYPIELLNHSVVGATTSAGIRHIKGALAKNPDAVILQLGANDMLQNVDPEKIKKNLQTLITAFKGKNIPVLLMGMEASATKPEEYRNNFRQLYEDLALENELLLYPFFMAGLWKEDGTHVSEDYFLSDQVHPSAKGVAVIVKHVLPVVEQFVVEDVADVTVKKE